MTEMTEKDIGDVISSISASFDAELFKKSEADLESYWHFTLDKSMPIDRTFYDFFDMLEIYSSSCRRWEEHHNGSVCVVERVRDRYIMPKIRMFLMDLLGNHAEKADQPASEQTK